MKKINLKKLCVTAIFLALGVVLSEVLPSIPMPLGGSVTLLSQVPIVLIAIIYGTSWGVFSGLCYGALQLLFGLSNVTYAAGISITAALAVVFLDYIIAYGVLGFSGLFVNKIKNKYLAIILGVVVALLLRYLCHIITGVTVWKELADFGAALVYSITYNGTYMIPEIIFTPIGTALLIKAGVLKALK